MAIQTRNSAVAIVAETTEATPVEPSASTQYIAIQADFSMSPDFDILENNELKASLAPSEPALGLENPSASFSHYFRHSGTEGDAPNYGPLLKASIGNEDDAGVEHNTVAGSTVAVVNVDTGEGATYIQGQALLVKNPSAAYEIRAVQSISSDALTLGFNLNNAPGTGVDLGEAITYYPANSGHDSLTLWHYIGNASNGAVEMMAGSRVTGITITFEAGQYINASYTLEGVEFYWDPITLSSSEIYLDFTDDVVTDAGAVVTAKTYKDPHELAAALTTAMNDLTTETHSVVYNDSTGKFTVSTSTSTVLSLLWNTGTNTANTIGAAIGFSVAADDTGATTYTADNAMDWSSPQTPAFDSASPLVAKSNEVLLGDATDTTCFEASSVTVSIGTPKTDVLSVCADSGKSSSIINAREGEVTLVALLENYDADRFRRFRANTTTRFQYVAGVKSGGNWVAGKNVCVYMPTAKIASYEVTDDDGLVTLNMTLRPFADDTDAANGELYISFV